MIKAEKLHLTRVVDLGCIICKMPAEIHHLRTGHGVGLRASNYEVIPLCPMHHRNGGYGIAFHAGKQAFEANFGSQKELLKKVNDFL